MASCYSSRPQFGEERGSPFQEWRNHSQDHFGPLNVGLRSGKPGVTALVAFAGELELQGVLQDLVRAERKVIERRRLLGEGSGQLVDVVIQLVGRRCDRRRRLALPQGVLEPEKPGPARIVDALGQSVGSPIDLVVEVPERVVRSP